MLKGKVETLIFDIDGTLHPEISWLKLTEGLGANKEEHASIFDRFTKNEIDYPTAKGQLVKLWQSSGNANKVYMEAMFRSWTLADGAEEVIEKLRSDYNICLISGAVDLYVETVAKKLRVRDWYANTKLIWDEMGSLIDFDYFRDQAQKKLEHFEEYVKKKGLDKNKCCVIGNGDSDIVLFKTLPYGIAIDNDLNPEVKTLAFRTLSKVSQLTEIF